MTKKAFLIAAPVAAFALGYWVAPLKQPDTEVDYPGPFTVDTKKVLAATVESLRTENKLQVYSYKGTAHVKLTRTVWWIFSGKQELIVPATVTYYIDLSELDLGDVDYNEKAQLVTVKLPKLKLGPIAFEPENATTVNGGIITWSEEQVEELRKQNYQTARKAVIAQAQGKAFVTAARRQAEENVEAYFKIPLRIVGHPDIEVVAKFD